MQMRIDRAAPKAIAFARRFIAHNKTPAPLWDTGALVAKFGCSVLASPDQIEDRQQNNRSQQRNGYRAQAEIAAEDVPAAD